MFHAHHACADLQASTSLCRFSCWVRPLEWFLPDTRHAQSLTLSGPHFLSTFQRTPPDTQSSPAVVTLPSIGGSHYSRGVEQVSTNVFVGAYIDKLLLAPDKNHGTASGHSIGGGSSEDSGEHQRDSGATTPGHNRAGLTYELFVHTFWVFSAWASRAEKEKGECMREVCPRFGHMPSSYVGPIIVSTFCSRHRTLLGYPPAGRQTKNGFGRKDQV